MSQNYRSTPGGWSAGSIMRDMYTTWRMFWDPRVPTFLKVLFPIGALIYWISPIDLLPGLPFDDIALLILAVRLFVQMVPSDFDNAGSAQPTANSRGQSAANSEYGDDNTIDTTWRVIKE